MSEQGQYRFCLERIAIGLDIEVDGWAFHETHGPCRLRLAADEHPLPGACARFGLPRGDVGLAFANPAATRCGFRLAAPLPDGARGVGLIFDGPGGAAWLPILQRTGPGPRDWKTLARPGPEAPDYRFLTPRGLAFAAARARSDRLGTVLGQFDQRAPQAKANEPVSIVVPVYGGKRYLHTLARTLLDRTDRRHPVFLVDDGNADGTISAFLAALRAMHDHITLVQMPVNTGFVGAAAAGVAQALRHNPRGHVIILNSDVEVPQGWVERLAAPLDADAAVASATPFTNSGTICGFPMIPDDNELFLGAGVEDIDAVFAGMVAAPVELPTGVGFCMAFSRHALSAIGFFDEAAFGRGYGEEVDWCRRAEARGFTNVLVPNVFVRHRHGASFSTEEKSASIAHSGEIISRRYPPFDAEVQDFLAADPAAPLRAAAAIRLTARLGGPGAVLVFDHGGHGGAVTVRQREITRLLEEGRLVALIRPSAVTRSGMPDAAVDIDLSHRDAHFHFEAQDLSDVGALAQSLPLAEILINSLVGFERRIEIMAFIIEQRRSRNVPLRMLHNDYFPICPSLNLIDAEDRYCAIPSAARCAACAPRNPHAHRDEGAASFDVTLHRQAWGALLAAVDRHVFFSRSSLEVMRRVFVLPDERISLLPHLAEHVATTPLPLPRTGDALRVAIVGGINVAKGAAIVAGMVALAERHRLPVVFELFGIIDRLFDTPHFHDNGPYAPGDLGRLIDERNCAVVFLPSIWPETHCYVLDEVIALGRPVGVFNVGAPAERIRYWPNGFVVPTVTAEAALSSVLQVAGMTDVVPPHGGSVRKHIQP